MRTDRRTLLRHGAATGITALIPLPIWAKGHPDDLKIDAFVVQSLQPSRKKGQFFVLERGRSIIPIF